MIPILSFSWPPVTLEGACGSAIAARIVVELERREDKAGMGFAVNTETLRAAAAAHVARCGAANAGDRVEWMFERIAVVARAGEAWVSSTREGKKMSD